MDNKVREHFGLADAPFDGEPDPRCLHPTRAHSAAIEELGGVVRRATPLTVLQGPDGAGKSMVLRVLAADLPERFELVVVNREARRLGGLWTAIAQAMGLPPLRERECRSSVEAHLARAASESRVVAIAIDDAHTLPDHWVVELERMTESEELTLVAACAGPLAETSRLAAAERLRARVVETIRLRPILESECSGYLQALLMTAGARESRLFDDESVATMHELSGGLPGRIGAIASRAMELSYEKGHRQVGEEAILVAAEELAVEAPMPPLRSVKSERKIPVPEPAAPEATSTEPTAPASEPAATTATETSVDEARRAARRASEAARIERLEPIEPVEHLRPEVERWRAVVGGARPPATDLISRSDSDLSRSSAPSRWPSGEGSQEARSQAPSGPFARATETGTGSQADLRPVSAAPSSTRPPAGGGGSHTPPAGAATPAMHVPEGVDPEVRRRVLAGARRPDRPSWDRAKTDPYRTAPPSEAPFGPDMLPVIANPHGEAAEWFRMVRMGVEEWMEERRQPSHSIMVSSAEAEAGKTFVAVNLALLFANEPGLRVLIVDGDLRRPRFEALFGLPSRPGLADVIAGRAQIAEAMQYVSEVGLYVLPAGRAGNPRDLVSPERLQPVLDEAKDHVDLIFLDAPSMSGGVDARAMAASVDGVLFAARAGQTRAPELVRAMRALDRKNLIGAVVTDVQGGRAEHGRGDRSRRR